MHESLGVFTTPNVRSPTQYGPKTTSHLEPATSSWAPTNSCNAGFDLDSIVHCGLKFKNLDHEMPVTQFRVPIESNRETRQAQHLVCATVSACGLHMCWEKRCGEPSAKLCGTHTSLFAAYSCVVHFRTCFRIAAGRRAPVQRSSTSTPRRQCRMPCEWRSNPPKGCDRTVM